MSFTKQAFWLLTVSLLSLVACTSDEPTDDPGDASDPATATTTDGDATNYDRLQGNWQDADDTLYTWVFAQNNLTDYIEGQEVEASDFELVLACDAAQPNKAGDFIRSISGGDTLCYSIIRLNDDVLELTDMEGEVRRFVRL